MFDAIEQALNTLFDHRANLIDFDARVNNDARHAVARLSPVMPYKVQQSHDQ